MQPSGCYDVETRNHSCFLFKLVRVMFDHVFCTKQLCTRMKRAGLIITSYHASTNLIRYLSTK